MKKPKIFKELDVTASLYIILFIVIMFSGSTLISAYVMQLICILILLLFGMARVIGIQKLAYVNRQEVGLKVIMVSIVFFLIYQLSFAYNPGTTLVFVERFIAYGMLFVFVPSLELSYRVIKAIRWYSYPVAISILLSTLINGSKSGGLVGNYQFAGMMMSIAFGVILINYYYDKSKWDLPGLIITILALFTSGKRSFSLLAIIAYMIVYKLNNDPKKGKKFMYLTAMIGVTVIIAYATIPAVRLVFERLQQYSGDTSYNGRAYFWTAARQIFLENQMTGIGMGCFSGYFDSFFHRLGNMEAYDAHNVYIQMAAELGIIGEGLFIGLFIVSLLKTLMMFKTIFVRENEKCMYVLTYSTFLQIWFIVYCLTGNPLYGAGQCFFYIAAIAMMLSVKEHVCIKE